jgi:arginine utilization regulatory protein
VSVTPAGSLSETTLTLEKTRILETLEMTMGNIAMAARRLGMSRQLLGYKLQKLKLRSALAAIKKKNPEN